MAREHDVVFIGAGHNGLTAAGYLAKAGLDVCLVEKAAFMGGAVNTQELTLPGFKHDGGGMAHIFIQANPLITSDELELKSRFGLKYIYPEAAFATVYPDDTALFVYKDLDRTCESIAQFSAHDAEAYRKFYELTKPLVEILASGLFTAPPPFGALMAQLDQSPVGQELIRSMMMSAWDMVNQWFEHDKTKIHLTKYVTEPLIGAEEKGSGVYLFLMVPLTHMYPTGLPEGGSGMLSEALGRAVTAHGGTILLNSEVVKIDVRGGRAAGVLLRSGEEILAKKAVVSGVDPRVVFTEWLADGTSTDFRRRVDNIQDPSFVGINQHLALNEPPRYKAGLEIDKAYCVEPVPWLEDYRRIYDDLRYGIPPKAKAPLVVCQTLHDPTRAPTGKHTVYLWHYEPWALRDGGPEQWDQIKTQVADEVLDALRAYAPNMTPENILARTIHSPLDYHRMNVNLYHGAALGPGAFMYQYFSYRPIPELGRYKTPIEGLYLVGHATHPGGGITGGGRAMVQALMEDLGIDFDAVVSGKVLAHA
ncbi:MAG: NAD(P)/FAD-dependent oxidoreductase [Chloroflexi bacterium]|nr:NAD(P)/FAD-dependent oxidoreductase [Chloroflexota bacterium]